MKNEDKLRELLSSLEDSQPTLKEHVSIADGISDFETLESFDDLMEQVENSDILNVDIIYYSRAMDYLRENDNSLNESMQIASEFGYAVENINSELLASLLASQRAREEFYSLEDEVNEFFESIEE